MIPVAKEVLKAIRRQAPGVRGITRAILVMFFSMLILNLAIHTYSSIQSAYQNLPIEYFIKISNLRIELISYTDERLILKRTADKKVNIPLNAKLRKEVWCSVPANYSLYQVGPGDLFPIDKFREQLVAETQEIKIVEATQIEGYVEIPVTERVKRCTSLYEKDYYSVQRENGSIAENAFVLVSEPIPIVKTTETDDIRVFNSSDGQTPPMPVRIHTPNEWASQKVEVENNNSTPKEQSPSNANQQSPISSTVKGLTETASEIGKVVPNLLGGGN